MKKLICVTLVSLGLIFAESCGSQDKEAGDPGQTTENEVITLSREQFIKGGMELGHIRQEEIKQSVTVAGTIDVPPENRVDLNSYHAGYIKAIPLLVGDHVKAGQTVAILENPEFVKLQQEYLEIASQLDFLRSEYERQQILLKEQISSRKNFLQAESRYKSTLATYNGLRKNLELLHLDPSEAEAGNIRSTIPIITPIGGTISKVSVSRGTYVSPADPILEIINKDHIHLELSVFEKDILKIEAGQPVNFTIPEASNEQFTAKVYLVGASLDPATRTVKVHAHLDDSAPVNLAIGMFVEAAIVTGKDTFNVLPEAAIVQTESGTYACLLQQEVDGNLIFKRVLVEPGVNSGGFTVIKNSEGFPKDSQFLLTGANTLIGTVSGH